MHHAPCTTHHAPRTMHHASCPLHHLSYVLLKVGSPRRRVVLTSSVLPDAATHETGMVAGTPAAAGAATTPLVLVHRRGGSSHQRLSPPPYPSPSKNQGFQPSTAHQCLPVCALCLATDPHDTRKCCTDTLWKVPRPGVTKARRADSSTQLAPPFAAIGTVGGDAPPAPTSSVTSVLDAETRIMGLRNALELRRNQALTPYKVEAWEHFLLLSNLSVKYPTLVTSLRRGFDAGIPPILSTYAPPNSPSLLQHPEAYHEMVANELRKGRYIGPCTRLEVEALIGPFQSSPLSWVPKPGKPGKFRAVHNFSFPRSPTPTVTSINAAIDADRYPCTWGTFDTICFITHNLPPGSQAAIRDVAEAYRTIPITPDQWPGLVVKLLDEDEFAINICNNFGLTSAGGVYGEIGDATLDIFRTQGIGPISKWVDDHIFFRIPIEYRAAYNLEHQRWHSIIVQNGGRHQSGSRFWYQGESLPDGSPAEFDEDAACPITDYSSLLNRSEVDSRFSYCDANIDLISAFHGNRQRPSPFRHPCLFLASIGTFLIAPWPLRMGRGPSTGLQSRSGSLTPPMTWRRRRSSTASCCTPAWSSRLAGCTSLTWNASWLPLVTTPLFLTTPLVTPLPTFLGGWTSSFPPDSQDPSQAPPASSTDMPSQTPAQVLASALLSATNGERGICSQDGKPRAEISDGLRPLVSSLLHALSPQLASQVSTSGSSETTGESLKAGGRAEAGTGRPTRSSGTSTTSQILTSAFLSHVTSPAERTQQTVPQGDSTLRLLTSSQLSASQSLSGNSSLIPTIHLSTEQSTSLGDAPTPACVPPITTSRICRIPPTQDRSPPPSLRSVPRRSKPSVYSPSLCPHPSPLRPHCLAQDRLRRWRPSPNVSSRHVSAELGPEELERVFNVMSNAWAESTRESYSSGILVYHVFCDARNVPEELRAPANQATITSFIVSLAGSYSGSTISNYIHGIRAWHVLHGLEWRIHSL